MKKNIGFIVIGLLLVVCLLLCSVGFAVHYQHKALVLTFGKVTREINEAGLKWKWPWPIQSSRVFDGRIRTLEGSAMQTITRDSQNIIVTVFVNWRISNARQFYETFLKEPGDRETDLEHYAEDTLKTLISNAINVFTEYNFGQLVTLDVTSFKLPEVERGKGGMLERLREVAADGEYGIEIVDVGIKQLGVPDSVTTDVFERVKKDRERDVTLLTAQGDSDAQIIRSKAENEARRIRTRAETEALKIEGEADAKTVQYYEAYSENPTFSKFVFKLRTLRSTLGERTTLVGTGDSPLVEMFQKGPQVATDSQSKRQQDCVEQVDSGE